MTCEQPDEHYTYEQIEEIERKAYNSALDQTLHHMQLLISYFQDEDDIPEERQAMWAELLAILKHQVIHVLYDKGK